MGVLQRFERRIEELVNRPFARAFKAEVQPVEIASALQRELDDRAAIVARGRTMVPNQFRVTLGEHDHARLDVYREALSAELADMVSEHAEEQGYAFIGPVSVAIERDDELGHRPVQRAQRCGRRRDRPQPGHRQPRRRGHAVGRGRFDDVRPRAAHHAHRAGLGGGPADRRPRHLPRARRAPPLRR